MPALAIRELYCPSHFGNTYEVTLPNEMTALLSEANIAPVRLEKTVRYLLPRISWSGSRKPALIIHYKTGSYKR